MSWLSKQVSSVAGHVKKDVGSAVKVASSAEKVISKVSNKVRPYAFKFGEYFCDAYTAGGCTIALSARQAYLAKQAAGKQRTKFRRITRAANLETGAIFSRIKALQGHTHTTPIQDALTGMPCGTTAAEQAVCQGHVLPSGTFRLTPQGGQTVIQSTDKPAPESRGADAPSPAGPAPSMAGPGILIALIVLGVLVSRGKGSHGLTSS